MTDTTDDNDTTVAGQGPGANIVPRNGIIAIGTYLVAVTTLVGSLLVNQFPQCNMFDRGSKSSPPSGSDLSKDSHAAAPTAIRVDSVEPAKVSAAGGQSVTIVGMGFAPGTRVFFDGSPASDIHIDGQRFLTAASPRHDPGPVAIVVANEKELRTFAGLVTYTCPPVPDKTMVYLVLLAGALGGLVHALRSFFWYVGNRQLVWSWTSMYALLPFTSASLAFVFFLLARAGLYQPSGDASLLLVGLAALVGMFSTQAAQKLTDIAEGIFTKAVQGANHVAAAPLTTAHAPSATTP